jgi:AAA family ATP:ADP antiporter
MFSSVSGLFSRLATALWGNLSKEEMKRFGMLSMTFLFIIGSYWLMRPIKDALFMRIVGKTYIPTAKIASFFFIIPLLMFYSKLVDMFSKQNLFYIICTFYAALFLCISYLLTHPTIGLANTVAEPTRALGWVIYLGIESFGSLVVSLFWSFVSSSTDQASAKRGYALIIAGAQIGSITGPTLATYASLIGMPQLAAIVSFSIMMVVAMVFLFTKMNPAATEVTVEKKKKTGTLEGMRLLLSRPYLLGILGVSTLYEVVGTILDYQMKFIADESFTTVESVTEFLGRFGQATNFLALIFAFIGTSFFIRRFGLTFCLTMFPVTVACVVVYTMIYPTLWGIFGAMVAVKGLSYALNNPCKEIMWIPTSKDAKFKAKSVIDGLGGRAAKATGSGINGMFAGSMTDLLLYGSLISLGIVGVWIMVAMFVGKSNERLTAENKIVE